ncbi:hypothetical protein LUZ60_003408 [Juncus effusus]|nr:hypothetical protein LUZ60_003408 [Juncus effusus]
MRWHEMETPRRNWIPSYTRERHSHSISAVQEDILNISPRLSHYNPGIISIERRMHKQSSLSKPQDIINMSRKSTSSLPSTEANTPKSATDLVNEIATLEVEVIHLERHLLSLYRIAFDNYLINSPISYSRALSSSDTSFDQSSILARCDQSLVEKKRQSSLATKGDEPTAFTPKYIAQYSPALHKRNSFSDSKTTKLAKSEFGHRSLADHFGASITEHMTEISPHRLSEEIIKCISSVYCMLAKPATISSQDQCDTPRTPSVSSSNSSLFSPMERCDSSWSPNCRFESPKEKSVGLYHNMIIVPFIRIDADRFGYASKMLQNFRSLVKRLEKIDPRKMTHEEQLTFWINVHNSLVMHAFLAYGLRQNRMRSTHMILKAAYNVGGHSVNACSIEGSILRCQPHRPALWVHTLFSSRRKSTNGNEGRHPYALHHPEPLAHFALCTGAVSDPPVRLYTAKRIYMELEVAKAEFIQANIVVKKQSKILLPRMLYYYGRDSSLELCDIIEIVCKCMPESQQRKDMERICLRKRVEKYIEWLPYKSSFTYLVHRDLAQQ